MTAIVCMSVLFVSACGSADGERADKKSSESAVKSPRPTPSATAVMDLCSLLGWSDLSYPAIGNTTDKPTKIGHNPDWQQSCQWMHQQINAGYTPPQVPNRDKFPPGLQGDMQALSGKADALAELLENSSWIGIDIAYNPGRKPTVMPTSYEESGHTVYLSPPEGDSTCGAALSWSQGLLGVVVNDPTQAFGSPCDEVKKLVTLLTQREPGK